MAAPSTTARVTPAGIVLPDGHSTQVAFSLDPNVAFWEKNVTPPGLDGGEPIDTTTMFNATYRTFAPRALMTLTPMTMTGLYDPDVYDEIIAIINNEGSITVHFSDGSTLDFFGYLQKFDPAELVEGTAPEATITIVPTNYDPVNHVEAGPVMTEVAGT